MGTALTDLLGTAALGHVTRGIQAAISKSFRTHPVRHRTDAEVKRRFEICIRWFKAFRFEKKYSIERSVDEMGHALAADLSGVDYAPKRDRAVWAPDAELVAADGTPLSRAV